MKLIIMFQLLILINGEHYENQSARLGDERQADHTPASTTEGISGSIPPLPIYIVGCKGTNIIATEPVCTEQQQSNNNRATTTEL